MSKKATTKKGTKKATPKRDKHIDDLLHEAETVLDANLIPAEVVPETEFLDGDGLHEDVNGALKETGLMIQNRDAKHNQGAFPALHTTLREKLNSELETQERLASATLKVVGRTTAIMKAGLEQALADLKRQTTAMKNGQNE